MKIAEGKIAVFAGTTEGRVLASRLAGSQVAADVFVATEYGKEVSEYKAYYDSCKSGIMEKNTAAFKF